MMRSDRARWSSRSPAPAPAQSSAAERRARAISSTGAARSTMGRAASGCSVICPTPTRTGVRGSSTIRRSVSGAVRPGPGTAEGPRYASPMRIAVGSDHAGYRLKQVLAEHLSGLGHEVEDLGTHSEASVDYPVFGAAVGRAVI